jgi:hypothetical protein
MGFKIGYPEEMMKNQKERELAHVKFQREIYQQGIVRTENDIKMQDMEKAKEMSHLIEKTYKQREDEENKFLDMKQRA